MGFGAGANSRCSGESKLYRLIKKNASSRYVVFDVGANAGQFLSLMEPLFGGAVPCTVHSFEPGDHSFNLLKARYEGHSNVVLNHLGVGKESGTSELFYDQPGSPFASMTDRDINYLGVNFKHRETITLTTIDEYCAKHAIDHIDLLKVDVEGHELSVLQGAQRMLHEKRIKALTFEFGGGSICTRSFVRDFFRFLEPYGMQFYRVTPSGYVHPIAKYSEFLEKFAVTNFLVTQPGYRT